jgi:hypothetical protein
VSANLTKQLGNVGAVSSTGSGNAYSWAVCPAGTHAVSGGWTSDNGTTDAVTITESAPNYNDTMWIVFAVYAGHTVGADYNFEWPFQFQAVAICG